MTDQLSETIGRFRCPSKALQGRVFLLGLGCHRQTVYTQQVRALNLVYAMQAEHKLIEGNRVVVIGGGVAGLTAAVAAATQQARDVVVLERQPYLLHLQRGNRTRWLHPHIYDWPRDDYSDPEASLPFLRWRAGTAGDVATTILEEFAKLQKHAGVHITTCTNAGQVRLQPGPSAPASSRGEAGAQLMTVTWNQWESPYDPATLPTWRDNPVRIGEGFMQQDAEVVIVATGFGVESGTSETTPSYWRNDDFEQPELTFRSGRRRVLVSGTGDGGLVDVLRLRISRFDHGRIVEDFFPLRDREIRGVIEKLEALRARIHAQWVELRMGSVGREAELNPILYQGLEEVARECQEGMSRIDARIRKRLRTDTDVFLNGDSYPPFSIRTSLLNVFLVWRLLNIDVQYIGSPMLRVPRQAVEATSGGDVEKHHSDPANHSCTCGSLKIVHFKNGEELQCDKIVIRHGARDDRLSAIHTDLPSAVEELERAHGLDERLLFTCEGDHPYVVEQRWNVSPRHAGELLRGLGFRRDSAELRNRIVKWFPRGVAAVACETELREDGERRGEEPKRNPWRAHVIKELLRHVAQLGPLDTTSRTGARAIVFESEQGYGAGMTLLWWRFLASLRDRGGEDEEGLRHPDSRAESEARVRLIDYAAAQDAPLAEATIIIERLLRRARQRKVGRIAIVLDNFSQGIRHEVRRHASIDPRRTVEKHLEVLRDALGSGDPLVDLLFVLDEVPVPGTSVVETSASGLGKLIRATIASTFSNGQVGDLPTARLQGHSRLEHFARHIHRIPAEDDAESVAANRRQRKDDSALFQDQVGRMLHADVARLLDGVHRGEAMGRHRDLEDRRTQDDGCLFTVLRPVAEHLRDLLGFRASPFVPSVIGIDAFLDSISPFENELAQLAEAFLRTANEIAQDVSDCRQTMDSVKRLHHHCWLAIRDNGLLATPAFYSESTLTTFYVADQMMERNVDGVRARIAGLFCALSWLKLEVRPKDASKAYPRRCLVMSPRHQVAPIAYSNLFSFLNGSLFRRLGEDFFRAVEVRGYKLMRPVLIAKCPWPGLASSLRPWGIEVIDATGTLAVRESWGVQDSQLPRMREFGLQSRGEGSGEKPSVTSKPARSRHKVSPQETGKQNLRRPPSPKASPTSKTQPKSKRKRGT